jgi:hypothetical protein
MRSQRKWTKAELAYFAGLIDGEGSIHASSVLGPRGYRHYYPVVDLTNTNVAMLRWVHAKFGGHFRTRSLSNADIRRLKSHRPKYAIDFRKAELLEFLPLLIPYLVAKRRQAEIVLEYYQRRFSKGLWRNKESGRFLPHPYTKKEHELLYELKVLNQRGRLFNHGEIRGNNLVEPSGRKPRWSKDELLELLLRDEPDRPIQRVAEKLAVNLKRSVNATAHQLSRMRIRKRLMQRT